MNFNSNYSHPDENSRKMGTRDEIPSLGLGIKLIGQIADELSYTYNSDRRNCLSIVKFFQPVLPQYSNRPGAALQAKEILKIFNWLNEQKTDRFDRTSQQPFHKITLQLKSEVATVTQVLWWMEQLENLPIPESVLQLCKLACVEGFVHAIHHHKNMPPDTPIELEIAVFSDCLEMKIWDWGQPFDFKKKLDEVLQETDIFGWQKLGFAI